MCGDSLSDITTTVLYKFLLFQQPGQLCWNLSGGKNFFLQQNLRLGSVAHPASYSIDTGVKHSGREVCHSSPPSAEVMSGAVPLLPPYAFILWTGTFLLIFHMYATFRAHHVAVMRLLCSVKLPSIKFLPAATSRVHIFSRHATLLSNPVC
jgi:hypothetical protein